MPMSEPPLDEQPVEHQLHVQEQPAAIDEAGAVEAELPVTDGALDFGDMQMMEEIASSAPPPVQVEAEPAAEPVVGIRRGKKKKKKAVVPEVDPAEAARLAAEKAEAEAQAQAQAEAEAEAARVAAAEQEALRLEQERAAAAEAARIAAEEEAKRLAMQSVSFKITELKRQLSRFNEGHAALLQQISRQRAAIASDEAKLAGLEVEIEQAMGREDYDHADRVQSDVDLLKGRVASGKQTLADNEQKAKEHDAKKREMLKQGVQLHAARVDELRAERELEMGRCRAFVENYGGRLADAEIQLRDITQQIASTLKSASVEETSVGSKQESVDKEVDQRTESIRADKEQHNQTIAAIDDQIAELQRQIEVKQAERQAEIDAIAVIDNQIHDERQAFAEELKDISERTELIAQKRADCESKKQAMETQWSVLDEYRSSAQTHRESYSEVINTLCKDADAVQRDKSMLGFWLACIDEDQQVEQGAQHRQELLKAKLTTAKGDLHEVESANSEFADGMRVLQTETAQLQAALARYEQQLPDLEGQKTAAASTRNFKEASRLSGEIKRVQGEQEQATSRLTTLQATIAQKESQNANVSKKLSAMQKAVDVAEKAVHTDRFDTLKTYIAKLQGRVAIGDEFNTAFSQAQLDMAASEANEIAERLGLKTVGSVEADTVSLPQIDAVTVDVANLPAPVPRMTTEEATLVLRSFASQNAELNAQLDTAVAAEEYDLCNELTLKIDQLQLKHAAAQETLGDKAANVTMSTEEAEKVVGTYADDRAGLEANLQKAMADEDYDQCDALQGDLDTLDAKKAAADASLIGGPAPVDNTAVAELNTLFVAEVPQFELPQIPTFESSAPNAQPPVSASMHGDAATGVSMYDAGGASMYDSGAGVGASMYDGADATSSMYEEPAAGAGASLYDDAGVSAGASMYGDAVADGGASLYDTSGGGGESTYADTGGASMYADTGGASMYADTGGASMYDDTGGASMYDDTGGASMYDDSAGTVGPGESMYSAGDVGSGGFDFVSGGGDTGENAGEEAGVGGFGFIGGADATSTAEAEEPSGGFGFIGTSDSAAAPVTDAAVTSEPAVAEGGGFSFIAGESAGAPVPAGGIYSSEPAASSASMYDDPAPAEGSANIYGEPSPSPYTLICTARLAA
eukprot:COSAG02_NODE_1763_length_11027_cov_4.235267_2_plen_1151_part_00